MSSLEQKVWIMSIACVESLWKKDNAKINSCLIFQQLKLDCKFISRNCDSIHLVRNNRILSYGKLHLCNCVRCWILTSDKINRCHIESNHKWATFLLARNLAPNWQKKKKIYSIWVLENRIKKTRINVVIVQPFVIRFA